MSEKSTGDVLLAFVLGGIVGAALGILYAPAAGKETRKKLKDMSEDINDKVESMGEDVVSKARQMVHDGKEKILSQKERLEEAFEAGKRAYEKKA